MCNTGHSVGGRGNVLFVHSEMHEFPLVEVASGPPPHLICC